MDNTVPLIILSQLIYKYKCSLLTMSSASPFASA